MPDNNWSKTRPTVCGAHGAVAAAHPLAALAGLDVLRSGGNAIDAVVATAVALAAVEPYMSGPGGVGYLIYHRAGGDTSVLNYTGAAPAGATPDRFTPHTRSSGSKSSLIPGSVAGWFAMLEKYGTRTPPEVFAPGIRYARDGFPLHPYNLSILRHTPEHVDAVGRAILDPVPKQLGGILRQPDLARTLELLAEHGPRYFYEGAFARRIADHVQSVGGLLTEADLAGYQPEWEQPIEIAYRNARVLTCAPNCEGFQILQTLKLLEAFDVRSLEHNSAEYLHVLSEAVKLAISDRIRYGGDPRFVPVPVKMLLLESYCAQRRRSISRKRASISEGDRWNPQYSARTAQADKAAGMTTHLSVVDSDGNVASITQSLGNLYGSGVFVPGTGVALNNFCHFMEVDPAYSGPNKIAPGKRCSCCLSPVQVFQGDKFWFAVATPGSYGILQTTVQMIMNMVDFGADPQAAIEAPRFRVMEGARLQIESRVPPETRDELAARGHDVELLGDYSAGVGGGQCVMIDPDTQSRMAGADPRRDGYALAW